MSGNRGRRGGGGGRRGQWGGGGGNRSGPRREPQPIVDSDNPIIQQFQQFAVSLDHRHDKRERIVKMSRDVTIEAKRIIFLLHRMKLDDVEDFRATESNAAVLAEAETRLKDVQANLWTLVATELEGEDPWFYLRAYTAGLQEYVEAVSFYHHLRHGGLVSWDEVSRDLGVASDRDVLVPRADYMLGIADLTGEVMRQAVNSAGFGNTKMCFELLKFLQEIHDGFVALPDSHREVPRKLGVLQSSLRKVENVCYNINVRGTEVPKHLLGTYMEFSKQPHQPPMSQQLSRDFESVNLHEEIEEY